MTVQSVVVLLTWAEIYQGASVGALRQITNLRAGRKDAYGLDPRDNPFEKHIKGCHGEIAVAKAHDRFWSGSLGNLGVADVGKIQVRATSYATGRLVLHHEDEDGDLFVNARVLLPRVELSGWLYAAEGKKQEYWQEVRGQPGRPAFFVPNEVLRPMSEFKALIRSAEHSGVSRNGAVDM